MSDLHPSYNPFLCLQMTDLGRAEYTVLIMPSFMKAIVLLL